MGKDKQNYVHNYKEIISELAEMARIRLCNLLTY